MRLWFKYGKIATLGLVCMVFATSYGQETQDTSFHEAEFLKRSFLTIRTIQVIGNKVTKKYIVLREVPFDTGKAYSISDLLGKLQKGRQNLMNTSLFVDATVDFTNWYNDSVDIVVDVKERWYYFPVPYFRPVDRNWNVWINQYHVAFDRVNYGIKFAGNNVSGRNDKLNLFVIGGYTRQLAVNYTLPYIDKALKHGIILDFAYSKNKELNVNTYNNKQIFYKDEHEFVREQFAFSLGWTYRKGSISRHTVRLGYTVENIADSAIVANPDFFGNGQRKAGFPHFIYRYQYQNVNYIPYPLKGFTWEFGFMKRGFFDDLNLWQFNLKAGKYWSLTPKTYFSLRAEGILKLPFDQPYYNQPMLGYGDAYLRGLEYYVIDGVAGGYGRATLSREILSVKVKTGLKSRTYGQIPFKVFLKAFADAGYVYSKNNLTTNTLTNRVLYTGGMGVDVITIYDFILRIEFSFNQFNEHAFFFHSKEN